MLLIIYIIRVLQVIQSNISEFPFFSNNDIRSRIKQQSFAYKKTLTRLTASLFYIGAERLFAVLTCGCLTVFERGVDGQKPSHRQLYHSSQNKSSAPRLVFGLAYQF